MHEADGFIIPLSFGFARMTCAAFALFVLILFHDIELTCLSVFLSVSLTVLLLTVSFFSSFLPICPILLPSPVLSHTRQDREAVEVANLEERKLVLKFEADELDRTRDELVRSLEEKRKLQVWLAGWLVGWLAQRYAVLIAWDTRQEHTFVVKRQSLFSPHKTHSVIRSSISDTRFRIIPRTM